MKRMMTAGGPWLTLLVAAGAAALVAALSM